MKRILTFLFCLALAASLQAAIPTPDSAVMFHLERDSRKWAPQPPSGSKNGFLMEFVPAGDSIKDWKEMAAQQIVFTKQSLRAYVDTWKGLLVKADPKVEVKEETLKDGSVFVTYTSVKADEMSMRRFMKGRDGIYMVAYNVRPKLKKEETFKVWDDIIRTSELVPNPEKKK
jgi:hypothetical protein